MAGKNRSSSSTTFDPELKNAALQVFRRGDVLSQQPYQPYDSATVAPLAPSQIEGMQMSADAARSGIGQDQLAQANTAAGRAAGFTPSFFDVNLGMNVPDVASRDISADQIGPLGALSPERLQQASAVNTNAFNVAPVTAQQIQGRTVDAQSLAGADLSPYQNQYQTQVIDTALGDIERSRLMAQNQNAADAIKANAFGGDRQAILESETNRGFADQAARTAATLRAQGFENAASRAEADIGRAQQAGFQTANLGAQADLANQRAGLEAGTLSAQLGLESQVEQGRQALQSGLAAQSQDTQRMMANQDAGLAAGQQNLNAELARQRANQEQNLAAQRNNAQLGFDAARSNQQAALEAETQRRSLESQLALDRERQNLSALGINLEGANALGRLGGQARDFAFGDAAALESVGDRQRESAQELLEDRYRRFLEQRDAPLRAFDILRAGAGILPSPVMQSSKGRGFTVLGG
jgi:hypothetical protein